MSETLPNRRSDETIQLRRNHPKSQAETTPPAVPEIEIRHEILRPATDAADVFDEPQDSTQIDVEDGIRGALRVFFTIGLGSADAHLTPPSLSAADWIIAGAILMATTPLSEKCWV
ncbi:MAG: hypothetical protein JSR91_28615 [Proteobacteria bacterium]|nr:hypothetical protein [Pseudomonadota bacterium]